MKKFVYNRTLLMIIALGFIAGLVIAGQRHAVEISNNQVDMVMDYDSLRNLAEIEGLDFEDVLAQAKDAGITSLAIYDTTLAKLTRTGKVIAVSGSTLIEHYHDGALTSILWRQAVETGAIDPSRVYVVGRDLAIYQQVKEDLLQRVGANRIRVFSVGEVEVLEVKARFGSFVNDSLGLPTHELDVAKNAGFMILARPSNFSLCTPDSIRAVFERLENYPVSEVVFDGPEILGADDFVDVTAEEMKKRDLTLGLIEHTSQLQFYNQRGMNQLARGIGYNNVARLYAIPKDEQPKLQVGTAINRWVSTDRERNIRINLLRIFEKPAPGKTLLETNLNYIRETSEHLKARGYTLGKAGTFENYYPNRILRVLVVVGVIAAGVLYLSLISEKLNENQQLQLKILFVLSVVAAIPILVGAGGKIRLLAGFMSANLFPVLAIIWQLDRLRFIRLKSRLQSIQNQNSKVAAELSVGQVIWLSAAALLIAGGMSMVGAVYLSGALSDVSYFLEFEIFRGIKLTFVLPLILVAVAFLQRFNIVDEARKNVPALQQVKEILGMKISVKAALISLVVFAGMVVLIARSGHTSGMPVSGAEISVRSALEQIFYARPRSKEIFFGHPAFILATAAFLKKFPKLICFFLTIAATIGQSSMVETFAHMRTPIFMSFMRGIDGIIPGAIIGAALILILHFAARFRKGV